MPRLPALAPANLASPAPARSRGRATARAGGYWVTTAPVADEMGLGGAWDVLRTPRSAGPSTGWATHLFPDHPRGLELLGAVALLVPRLPRLEEWAYAGAVFNYTGAATSHLAAGKADPGTLVFLLALTGLTAASWALRAPARHNLASPARGRGVWMVRGGRP
jgi:hypothetical protein